MEKITPQQSRLITPAEAAEILGVSPGTLSVWRTSRRYSLKFCKIGRKVMYRPEDVQAFISARTVGGNG